MRHRLVLLLPWLGALTAVILYLLVVPHDRTVGRVWNASIKSAAVLGALLAFLSYGRGDYMRRAWIALALSFVPLVARDVLSASGHLADDLVSRNLPQIVSNLGGVTAYFFFARAFRVAGLELPGSRGAKLVSFIVCVGLGVGLGGYALLIDVSTFIHGPRSVQFIGDVASDLGDVVGLALLAPIFLTALGLRGGLLARPWLLLVGAQCCWIVYDFAATLDWIVLGEAARSLACLHICAAGLAQRWLDVRALSEPPAAAETA